MILLIEAGAILKERDSACGAAEKALQASAGR
jgi:hypothetical protein